MDAGVSALQIRRRLALFGAFEAQLDAVLLSHEHSDHVRGLEVLLKRLSVPVWTSAGTWSQLALRSERGGELCSGRPIKIGSITITPVSTSHDAAEPLAMIFDDGEHRVGLCTDTGVLTALLCERLAGCDLLLLESNHDADLLRHGPYPWHLKQRIASRLGHLGNHQTEEGLGAICDGATRAVLGLHLSAENNQPDLVCQSLRRGVGDRVVVDAVTRTEMAHCVFDGGRVRIEKQPVPPARGCKASP
jgi:phosphoribosyl 1,2-cyclic phosphodiesterase